MNAIFTPPRKMNLTRIFSFSILLSLILVVKVQAQIGQTFYTKSNSANWTNSNAWEYYSNGKWNTPTSPPDITNPVVITRNIVIPKGVNANCLSLELFSTASSVELQVNESAILNVIGNVIINNATNSADLNSIDLVTATLNVGGTMLIGNNGNSNANAGKASMIARADGILKVTGNIRNNTSQNVNPMPACSLNLNTNCVLEIAGNLELNQKLTGIFGGNTTVRFNGTGFQTIPQDVKFGNISIANNTGVFLTSDLNTSNFVGDLVVESGILDDNMFTITGRPVKQLQVWNNGKLILRNSDVSNALAFPKNFGNVILDTGSTVTYNSTTIQKIDPRTYGKLELLGTGVQKFLDGNTTARYVTISCDLIMGTGKLAIDKKATLTVSGSINYFNNLSYLVMNNSNARLVVDNMGLNGVRNGEITFPIGTSNGYSPAYLKNNGATYNFAIGVENGVKNYLLNTPIAMDGVNKTWNVECLNRVNGSIPDAELRLQWDDQKDELPGFDRTKCYLTHYTNGAWTTSDDFQNATQSSMSVRMAGITSFSPFSVADAPSPLPVELVYFKANKKENGILLSWETASEKNCLGYDVLASADGKNFEAVGYIASKNGNANYAQRYEFLDKATRSGLVYYRLKQTDLDGTITYYATSVVNMGKFTESVSAFPNPFQNQFELKLQTAAAQEVELLISDLTGKTVYKKAVKVMAGENMVPVALDNSLPKGLYILTTKTAEKLYTTRIVKQ